ncbi:hypothetical protein E2C01_079126 [Portunus trituberculatus]|uniref:Uncharacterized protein n=1 Tax=Portunus trituberculatus TaxID=210409 RepID=A0A5B7IUQ8_PORTR|nr:hypothetical protein [Portunus trituberculatus]
MNRGHVSSHLKVIMIGAVCCVPGPAAHKAEASKNLNSSGLSLSLLQE